MEGGAGLVDREGPGDAHPGGIAGGRPGGHLMLKAGRPGGHLMLKAGRIGDAASQALPGQYAEFEFGEIEPAAVQGREAQVEFAGNAPGFRRRKGGIERGEAVGVESVEHHDQLLGVREVGDQWVTRSRMASAQSIPVR